MSLLSLDIFSETLKKSFTIKGRATRTEYWNFQILLTIFSIISLIITGILEFKLLTILVTIVLFSTIIPSFSLSVRRCHDINKSGWFILINIIPILGSLIYLVMAGFFPSNDVDNNY